MLNIFLFGAFPYIAMILFLIVSIERYIHAPFQFSSLSSQFLETRELFWGSVPFHIGILTLFAATPDDLRRYTEAADLPEKGDRHMPTFNPLSAPTGSRAE